jgi:cation diffusion facilitator CzcD-associated flavoprotein CzcO
VTSSVLVIGAGPAGLAVAAELRRRGVPAEIIERNGAVGSSWRSRYDKLRLNTHRHYSTLSGDRYPKGIPAFPTRDQFVRYLESYAERHDLSVRFGVEVERIDRSGEGWRVATSAGDLEARHVILATGREHTPRLPAWPGLEDYQGRLVHSVEYRNPGRFRDEDVLVVGAGSSALDIAYDLAQGGAARVRVSVRTQPQVLGRMCGPLPTYFLLGLLFRLSTRRADAVMRRVRRWTVGDLSPQGLTEPPEGLFTWTARTGEHPTVVGAEVIEAIKAGRVEIVPNVSSVTEREVLLDDGTALRPDTIIAGTGFTSGLEPMVGHLDVLDDGGRPRVAGGPAVLPGLRFACYVANIYNIDHDTRAVAEQVSRELAQEPAGRESQVASAV